MALRIAAITFLFSLVFLFSLHGLNSVNQDIGRHLTLGKIISETHHVPTTNLFSYTAPDYPFINHHWFGEVMLYQGYRVVGLKGLIVLKAIILTAAFGLAFLAFYKKETILASLVIGLCSVFILVERMDVRPEMFSFLFFSWFLFVLFRKRDSALVWTLPFVTLTWVNTHIYFFMAPFLYGVFLIGQWREQGSLAAMPRRLWWIGVSMLAALLINPFGIQGVLSPLLVLRSYGYSIVENQSPFFLSKFSYPAMTSWALYLGIVMIALSFILNYKLFSKRIFELLIALTTAVLSLVMIRNFSLFALSMIPVGVKNVYESTIRMNRKGLLIIAIMIFLALGYSIITNQVYAKSRLGRQFGLYIPPGAAGGVAFVRSSHLKGPMFNNFDIGSFLIWQLPEEKVFIDGRPEAYPPEFIQKVYIKMQEDEKTWQRYTKEYDIQYVFWDYHDVTPWSKAFLTRMISDPQWPLVYQDDSVLIFVKNTADHQTLIRSFKLNSVK